MSEKTLQLALPQAHIASGHDFIPILPGTALGYKRSQLPYKRNAEQKARNRRPWFVVCPEPFQSTLPAPACIWGASV
jgi:hypothetical protein